jgi:hypothetical protein
MLPVGPRAFIHWGYLQCHDLARHGQGRAPRRLAFRGESARQPTPIVRFSCEGQVGVMELQWLVV